MFHKSHFYAMVSLAGAAWVHRGVDGCCWEAKQIGRIAMLEGAAFFALVDAHMVAEWPYDMACAFDPAGGMGSGNEVTARMESGSDAAGSPSSGAEGAPPMADDAEDAWPHPRIDLAERDWQRAIQRFVTGRSATGGTFQTASAMSGSFQANAADVQRVEEASKKGYAVLGRELARLLKVVLGEGAEPTDYATYARELFGRRFYDILCL